MTSVGSNFSCGRPYGTDPIHIHSEYLYSASLQDTYSEALPKQQKFRALMNGAHLASPIRGEFGYAHWPHLGSQIYCPIGNQIWGPLGKQDLCPNGWQICVQQFGQL